MNKKNILCCATSIALLTLASCTSHKSTSKSSQNADSATSPQERARQREAKCLYTTQEPYASLWEKSLSQANLIESLKKRVTMLEERGKQKDGNLLPIPNMVVEPLAQTGIYKPHDRCMKQLGVKTREQLKADTVKQQAQILALQKQSTELMLDLRSRR